VSENRRLTDRVVEQALIPVRDHRQLLTDLVRRLEPLRGELADAWMHAYRDIPAREPLPPNAAIREVQEQALQIVFDGLGAGRLDQYLADVAAWAGRTARSGLDYGRVVALIDAYRQSGLVFLRRVYQVGPELKLVLEALDDLYASTVTVAGAAYVEIMQDQLVDTARRRVFDQLAAGAAHSLNNVLTMILGRTQLLLERAHDQEGRGELLEIQRVAIVGAQMVRRLQVFERVPHQGEAVETDVNGPVRDAAEMTRFVWRDQAEAIGQVVDVVKELGDVPPVNCNPDELRQVCAELILNAFDAMPRGGLITLRTELKQDRVVITVVDTGEGMPEETVRRVFDPFFTTRGEGHVGLGLSLARDCVERYHGSLVVESKPGVGSEFALALPVSEIARIEQPNRLPTPERPVRILIIDDEPAVRDIVAKFLAFRGYEVEVADGGPEGLDAYQTKGFDLVLTDLGMPGMSGWQVAREVKRLKPQTLVILMTGWSADLDPDKVKESGVDCIVHKPFDVDEIEKLVREAVALREKM
jgi:signal transduction histidine kinase/CheY-like chemotaxis protein